MFPPYNITYIIHEMILMSTDTTDVYTIYRHTTAECTKYAKYYKNIIFGNGN